MTKFDKLARLYITEVASMNDSYEHGPGYAVDIYLRRQGDVRAIKQQLMKELHSAIIGAHKGFPYGEEDADASRLVKSSAQVVPYKRSNENDSSVLELTVTNCEDLELLESAVARVLGDKFKYDIYPAGSSD